MGSGPAQAQVLDQKTKCPLTDDRVTWGSGQLLTTPHYSSGSHRPSMVTKGKENSVLPHRTSLWAQEAKCMSWAGNSQQAQDTPCTPRKLVENTKKLASGVLAEAAESLCTPS